jgi:hypothetical protein
MSFPTRNSPLNIIPLIIIWLFVMYLIIPVCPDGMCAKVFLLMTPEQDPFQLAFFLMGIFSPGLVVSIIGLIQWFRGEGSTPFGNKAMTMKNPTKWNRKLLLFGSISNLAFWASIYAVLIWNIRLLTPV